MSKFSKLSCLSPIFNEELIERWRACYLGVKTNTFAQSLFPIRDFALYRIGLGYEAAVPVLPKSSTKSFIPYILSQDELERFFVTCDQFEQTVYKISTLPIVFPVLFWMLYSCGLRISEALKLKERDVDLDNGVFTILNAKGGKDRLVPMSDSLRQVCSSYSLAIHPNTNGNDHFFYTRHGKAFNAPTIFSRYQKILLQSGIASSGTRPRIHDFRHSFAVHTMQLMYESQKTFAAQCLFYRLVLDIEMYMARRNIFAYQRHFTITYEKKSAK